MNVRNVKAYLSSRVWLALLLGLSASFSRVQTAFTHSPGREITFYIFYIYVYQMFFLSHG